MSTACPSRQRLDHPEALNCSSWSSIIAISLVLHVAKRRQQPMAQYVYCAVSINSPKRSAWPPTGLLAFLLTSLSLDLKRVWCSLFHGRTLKCVPDWSLGWTLGWALNWTVNQFPSWTSSWTAHPITIHSYTRINIQAIYTYPVHSSRTHRRDFNQTPTRNYLLQAYFYYYL